MQTVAQVFVEQFIRYGIEYIFCVPGASVDALLNELHDIDSPKLILCHHESTAGYMAASYGKITGKPAVLLVTAGPGATNAVSPVATANSENTPLILITGQMNSRTTFKPSHQVIDAQDLFDSITHFSLEITNSETAASAFDIAYQASITGKKGAVHLAVAADRFTSTTTSSPLKTLPKQPYSYANPSEIKEAAHALTHAKSPLIIVGGGAATTEIASAIQMLIDKTHIPLICTFEGAGTISKKQEDYFMGRLGVFQNQPCNALISTADVILSIGYNIAELDPIVWNKNNSNQIIHLHEYAASIDEGYQPEWQLIGEMATTINSLTSQISQPLQEPAYIQRQKDIRYTLVTRLENYTIEPGKVHPLYIIKALNEVLTQDNTVVTDVGSHQYWMSEHYYTFRPRYFLSSMGFQTMGVSLPFAIAAALVRKNHKVLSVSGDGSFLMCCMELATAVKLQLPLIHLVWKDHAFNLVEIQEIKKYQRSSGAVFESNIDFAKLAESFGATGFTVTDSEQLIPTLQKAMNCKGPVVIDITVDYSHNLQLVQNAEH